jgi:hypothetical protein
MQIVLWRMVAEAGDKPFDPREEVIAVLGLLSWIDLKMCCRIYDAVYTSLEICHQTQSF